jgi:ethanolamine ammonia-lyase small subunit
VSTSDKDRKVAAPGSVIANPWAGLRRYTPARIALGRSGVSLPTAPHLALQLAHAQARDAVHRALDVPALAADLTAIGLRSLALHSAALDRATYLRRPDLGRILETGSRGRLEAEALSLAAVERNVPREPRQAEQRQQTEPAQQTRQTRQTRQAEQTQQADEARRLDLAFIVADGLSAQAVQHHAAPVLDATLQRLQASPSPWCIAPVALVEQGRVALGDEVGACLRAALSVVLIGERPGLSSPDSLGLYITWDPQPGRLDAQRNCISNVRPAGLSYDDAAWRLCFLLEEARRRRMTGVQLKDESDVAALSPEPRPNFLIG